MAQALKLEQGSLLWHKFRKDHIGSSDIAVIMGLSPWKDAYTLWLEKTGRQEESAPTFAMRVGKDKEDEARQLYLLITGYSLAPKDEWVFEHENGFCSSSTDGITEDGKIVQEIKCSERTFKLAKLGKMEEHYKCQCQWHLMLSKGTKCDFIAYFNGEYILIEVFPDTKFQEKLLEKAIWFWGLVTSDTEPEKPKEKYEVEDSFDYFLVSERFKEYSQKEEEFSALKDEARSELIKIAHDRNIKGNGVVVYQSKGRETVDWNKVKVEFDLTEEKLQPFTRIGKPYPTVKEAI
jgi:putative phage-type endonuclease